MPTSPEHAQMPDPESIGRAMFRRQMAAYDLIGAMADYEWDASPEIRAFWTAEAVHVVHLLGPWLQLPDAA